jgi:hypothetical protein
MNTIEKLAQACFWGIKPHSIAFRYGMRRHQTLQAPE